PAARGRHATLACMRRRLLAGLVTVVVTLSAAAVAGQPAPASRPASVAEGRHLIWRVAKGDRTIAFLVGWVHVRSKDVYPLPPVFDTVFTQTGSLVEEVDLGTASDASALMPMAAGAVFTDGQSLRTVLDPATYAKVESKIERIGMPMALL